MYTKSEIEENITVLKDAYKRSVESGGVVSYSINSGQGTTTVTQASITVIRNELEYFKSLLNELEIIESGSHCVSLQGIGLI